MFRTAGEWIVYAFVRTAVAVVGIFPLSTNQGAVRVLAFLFSDVFRVRYSVLRENLTRAFPELSPTERRRLIRQMWNHLLLMGVEFVVARRMIHEENWRRFLTIGDAQSIARLFLQDRPIILVTGHFGNFEMGGYTLGLLGYPTFSVARSLDNRFLNRWLVTLRGSTGQFLIEKNGGYQDILSVLDAHGMLAFLADQSAGPKGCWVDFFRHPASAYKAMAVLSLQYNAPILVCAATRRDNTPMQFHLAPLGVFDPKEPGGLRSVAAITQWFTLLLEGAIRRHPEQYWWLHRRWKDYGRTISLETIHRRNGLSE